MEILKGVESYDKSLYIKDKQTLIIGDLHIGKEDMMRKGGLQIPVKQFETIFEETKSLLTKLKPKKIILNGDVKHHFGTISIDEWDKILKYLRMTCSYGETTIIKGNHDKIMKPVTDKLKINLVPYIKIENIYICHGDNIPDNKDFKTSKIVIIGHEHPAITLRDGLRAETYKCFLKGKYKGKQLIVMPSINPLSEGTNILAEKLISPFLTHTNLSKFNVYIIGEKTYDFGKLGNLEK